MSYEEYEKRIENEKNTAVDDIKKILLNLKNNGCIGTITMEYHGSGDSGDFEAMESDGFDLDDASASELETHIDALLPPGWEINEGSYGRVTMNTANQSIHIDHENIVESTEHEDFDW